MKNTNKIINFNQKKKSVSNLEIYSDNIERKNYRLCRRFLPVAFVVSITLGVIHFLGGYSLSDGNIMKTSSYTYGDNDEGFNDLNGKKQLVYYGEWEKNDGRYERQVNLYNAEYFNYEHVIDILKNKDNSISVLSDYCIKNDVEYCNDISINDKVFNNSSMYYTSFNNSGYDEVANVGMSGIFFPLLIGSLFDFGIFYCGKTCSGLFDDEKTVNFRNAKKNLIKKNK